MGPSTLCYEVLHFEVIEGSGGRSEVRNRYNLRIARLTVLGPHRRTLALQVFDLLDHAGLLKLGSRCQVLGGPGVAFIWLSGQRGSEGELEVLLDVIPRACSSFIAYLSS